MNNYRLDQHIPRLVRNPTSVEEVAAILREATAADETVVPWGAGTRQHLGYAPARYDYAVSMTALDRVIEHTPADLVLTVEAGARLGTVQAMLAQHGQWLPWDPPHAEEATIGGLLASGASGPLRLGYGMPRDWTLGMRVALGDGRLVKSGAKVVKNVAGYDTHKLHLGAFGTLGIITEVTFKVAPLPATSQTLLAVFTNPVRVMQVLGDLHEPPLRPAAMLALSYSAVQKIPALDGVVKGLPEHILVVARFAGVPAAVNRQMREAARRCVELDARCIDLSQQDEQQLWAAVTHLNAPCRDGSMLIRMGVRPGEVFHMVRSMEQVPTRRGWDSDRSLVAKVGLGFARWHPPTETPVEEISAALEEQRTALMPYGGYCVVEEAPAALVLDRWGPAPPTIGLMRGLRAAWDPAGVLNPGRYLV
jgi:glycolate oxidase FAD binding subunit